MDQPRLEHGLTERLRPAAAGHEVGTAASRFPPAQRRILLMQAGLGEGVLRRLEAAGFASMELLVARGVEQAIDDVSRGAAAPIGNRRRAIERAIAAWQRQHDHDARSSKGG